MLDRLFDPENRFWTFANKVADMVVLGFLCLVCSLPLVTAGAAFAAFWRMMLELVRDEEAHIFSGYFHAFRGCLLTGTAAWGAHLVLAGFLLFDAFFALRTGTPAGAFLAGLFGALLLLLTLSGLWLYPLIGFLGLRWREAVVRSCLLAVRHLLYGLAGLALLGLALAVSFYVRYTVLFLPVLACYGIAKIINRVLQNEGTPGPDKAADEE